MRVMCQQYDLIFITTCTDDKYINAYLLSVINNNQNIDICIILLLQNGLRLNTSITNERVDVHFIQDVRKLSLSKARNICLDYMTQNNIHSRYIMFPDDDSSFDSLFFERFNHVVNANTLIDVLCNNTNKLYQNKKKLPENSYTNDYQYAMSVNMITKYPHVLSIGKFDENLGVGAKYGAGEDSDFFVRACKMFGPFKVTHELYNFHPAPNDKNQLQSYKELINKYKKYGEGIIYFYNKHNMHFSAFKCIIAALVGSLKSLIFDFNLKLSIARLFAFGFRLKTYLKLRINTK